MGAWKSLIRGARNAIHSPTRVVAGAGSAARNITVGAATGYVGWEALVNDKPVMQTVGETLVGKETNKAIKESVHGTASAVADTVSAAKDVVTGASEAVHGVNLGSSSWGGIGEFFRNIFGGNGTDMFGNLFSNIFSGKVSMMSMLGLVASGMLIFGRFGWMGKIAGALMGMMLVGNNSKKISPPSMQSPSHVNSQYLSNSIYADGVHPGSPIVRHHERFDDIAANQERPTIRR